MKGLILAAGLGTRLRPLTRPPSEGGRSKPLVPLANQPLIAYPLQKLILAGITDIGIVVGENEDELRTALHRVPAGLTFIPQAHPQGLAHAVDSAREFVGADDFTLLFCDNLFAEPLSHALAEWEALRIGEPSMHAMIHTFAMPDPRACGVAVVQNGWVVELEEKPAVAKSNLAVIGIDLLTPAIFGAISRIEPSARGELEITDAIAELIALGHKVRARQLSGFWFDTGTFADLISAHRPVMEEFGAFQAQGRHARSELRGPVGIARESAVEDSTIDGPVLVDSNSLVTGSWLGPYVSVGKDCTVAGCTLSDCQVYAGTRISGVSAAGCIFDGELRFAADGLAVGL
jgi:glucose-1-phosphate thymidylyltransferase